MSENTKKVEQHGCLVCGKVYALLVIYDPAGQMADYTVTSPGGRRVQDVSRPLVACNTHPESQVNAALARHYPGKEPADPEEE
jgi:hypothetical protein